jgi:hypothetical protein
MADTARNKAALLTLLADNTSGAISPQDLRDLVVSVQIHGATCWDIVDGDPVKADNCDMTLEAYRDTNNKVYVANHDAVNKCCLKYCLPHRYSTGSVRLNARVIPCATAAGNVIFKTLYAWERDGYTMPSSASWSSATTTLAVTSAGVYKCDVHHLATIAAATGCGPSSTLWVTVKRVGTSTSDTYSANKTGGDTSANLAITRINVHYPVKQGGTEGEYS